jgi:hypothetical protein
MINGHQPMSTELSQLGLDGEQQLGINPGSSEMEQQMGINSCPLSSLTAPNRGQQLGINPGSLDGGQQMGINLCPYTMEDNKWESTHVHTQWRTTNGNQPTSTKLILLGICSHKIVGKGWDKPYKTYWCCTHIIIKGCGHNMVDNKWELTRVY